MTETFMFSIALVLFIFLSGILVGGIIVLESLEAFIEKEKERDGIERKTDVI